MLPYTPKGLIVISSRERKSTCNGNITSAGRPEIEWVLYLCLRAIRSGGDRIGKAGNRVLINDNLINWTWIKLQEVVTEFVD
jgi:hypothetical protein